MKNILSALALFALIIAQSHAAEQYSDEHYGDAPEECVLTED
jgi:hypothetical protein